MYNDGGLEEDGEEEEEEADGGWWEYSALCEVIFP